MREYHITVARDTIETARTVVTGATDRYAAEAEALARARAGQLDFEPVQFRIGGESWVEGWHSKEDGVVIGLEKPKRRLPSRKPRSR